MFKIGKYIGFRDGFKIFRNVVREEGSKIYDTTKTYYTYVNKDGNVEKVLSRNVITKSDIHKKGVVPRSVWTTNDMRTGAYSETSYYPRAISKYDRYPDGGYLKQDLFLSKDGKNVTGYAKETPNYNAGITYGNPRLGRYDSRNDALSTINESKCDWVSLSEYNSSHPYYKFK